MPCFAYPLNDLIYRGVFVLLIQTLSGVEPTLYEQFTGFVLSFLPDNAFFVGLVHSFVIMFAIALTVLLVRIFVGVYGSVRHGINQRQARNSGVGKGEWRE